MYNRYKEQCGVEAKLFRGFGDPSRLSILDAPRHGPLTVSEIIKTTGLSQSNASNHLGGLRDCGLVAAARKGRLVYYRLSDKRVDQLLRLADDLLVRRNRGRPIRRALSFCHGRA